MPTLNPVSEFNPNDLHDFIGKAFFFRTVTYHLIGRVKNIINDHFFVLEDASWIPDSGRFMQSIKEGTLTEVEPVGYAVLNIQTVTDIFPWQHPLPEEQR